MELQVACIETLLKFIKDIIDFINFMGGIKKLDAVTSGYGQA